jgi:hypothetical protein
MSISGHEVDKKSNNSSAIGEFGVALAIVLLLLYAFFLPIASSHKVGPAGQAEGEALSIAIATVMYVKDGGTPPDAHALTKTLFDPDKSGYVYLYRNAFKFNAKGQVCDPAGHPYQFTITSHSITVTSPTYPASATENF